MVPKTFSHKSDQTDFDDGTFLLERNLHHWLFLLLKSRNTMVSLLDRRNFFKTSVLLLLEVGALGRNTRDFFELLSQAGGVNLQCLDV